MIILYCVQRTVPEGIGTVVFIMGQHGPDSTTMKFFINYLCVFYVSMLMKRTFIFFCKFNEFSLIMYSKYVWPNLIWSNKGSVWLGNVT